jgi:two-component system sensor histidine kinase EvgS/two-component system sensor histidine kinase/response regulator
MMLKIKENGSALLTFINDILDLAKIEAGRMDWVRREFDLLSMLESVAEKYSVRCADEGVSWKFDFGEFKDSLWVIGDEKKLLQTLSQLLNLSIQRSRRGSVCLKVASRLNDNDNDTWIFSIEDSGKLPKFKEGLIVGDSFEITEAHSDRNMALSIGVCKRLTQLMKGSFSMDAISSEGGVKTCIELPLPCVKVSLKPVVNVTGGAFDPSKSVIGQGDNEESQASGIKVEELSKLKLCEQMREAVYSGAATWMDDLISELEKIGLHESEVANKMREALRSYKMDQLAQLIDQIDVGDSV